MPEQFLAVARRFGPRAWVLLLATTFFLNCASAQRNASLHADLGDNVVSGGLFVRTGLMGAYEWNKFKAVGGAQFSLVSDHEPLPSAFALRIGREFSIREVPFDIYALGMINRYYNTINEYNWGVLGTLQRKHFSFGLGTNFRTFALTKKAAEDYPAGTDHRVHENWNVLYSVGYRIKPQDHPWNAGLTFTNYDRFHLGQETNPGIFLHGEARVREQLSAFLEFWHKRAGAMNLSVSYFGYFIRAGLKWEFATK